MRSKILYRTDFSSLGPGWDPIPGGGKIDPAGLLIEAPEAGSSNLSGPGIHTANGDTIELRFEILGRDEGRISFGFSGGMESATATLDFAKRTAELRTSDWSSPQPADARHLKRQRVKEHVLRIEKREGCGNLVKMANITVALDDQVILEAENVDVLPEMGVRIGLETGAFRLRRFTHRGKPRDTSENLHVAGWQILNEPNIDANT